MNPKSSVTIQGLTNPKGGQQPAEGPPGFPSKVISMLNPVKADTPKALSENSIKVVSREDISKMQVDKKLIAALRLKKLNRL